MKFIGSKMYGHTAVLHQNAVGMRYLLDGFIQFI